MGRPNKKKATRPSLQLCNMFLVIGNLSINSFGLCKSSLPKIHLCYHVNFLQEEAHGNAMVYELFGYSSLVLKLSFSNKLNGSLPHIIERTTKKMEEDATATTTKRKSCGEVTRPFLQILLD